ncbi:MAG: type II secretion system protein J [Pyrinomonadaceae bacterium]
MPRPGSNDGFSLLEMIVCTTVLVVIATVALSILGYSIKTYQSQHMQADMHAGLRSTLALMAQEVGQAGSLGSTAKTLNAAVTGSATAQTVNLNSIANIFVGQKLTVDTGSAQELVQVTALPGLNQVTGIFKQNHASGAPVVAQGVFPQGILSSSTATSLKFFGDINADGSLAYVQYDFDSAVGTLTRSITTLAPGVTTRNASETLLTNLVANPDGTPFFQYSSATNVTVSGTTYTFIPSVAVSLTLQTSKPDLQTGGFVTMNKSFVNLTCRNVLAGLTLAQANPPVPERFQPTPPGLPLAP